MKRCYKRFERYVKLCLITVIVVMVLVGCSKERDVVSQKNEEVESIVIKWMVYGDEYKDSIRVFRMFNEQLKAFYPDTTVVFEVVEKENYKDKWDMKMATNEPLDIAWIGQEMFNYNNEVKKGSFMAVDYLLATYGQDLLTKIPQELWNLQVREGNTFAIPIEGALYRRSLGIVTKAFFMKASGQEEEIRKAFLSNPYTDTTCYVALEHYLDYVKEHEYIGTGISYKTMKDIANRGLEGIYGMDSPFVIKIFDEQLKVYNKYELGIYREFFETMHNWYENGYIRKDIIEVINSTSEDGKEDGSILYIDGLGEEGMNGDLIETEYESVSIPTDDYRYIAYDSCRNALVIPKSSENPQRAMQIISLLYSSEGQGLYRLLVNGIENDHYLIHDENLIARRRDNEQRLLYSLSPYTIGNTYQNYELSKDQYKHIVTYNNQSIESELIGFNLDTRMIVIELTKMDLVIGEYGDRLSQGSADDWAEMYEAFLAKMNIAGSDKIIEELQRQIDEFVMTEK